MNQMSQGPAPDINAAYQSLINGLTNIANHFMTKDWLSYAGSPQELPSRYFNVDQLNIYSNMVNGLATNSKILADSGVQIPDGFGFVDNQFARFKEAVDYQIWKIRQYSEEQSRADVEANKAIVDSISNMLTTMRNAGYWGEMRFSRNGGPSPYKIQEINFGKALKGYFQQIEYSGQLSELFLVVEALDNMKNSFAQFSDFVKSVTDEWRTGARPFHQIKKPLSDVEVALAEHYMEVKSIFESEEQKGTLTKAANLNDKLNKLLKAANDLFN